MSKKNSTEIKYYECVLKRPFETRYIYSWSGSEDILYRRCTVNFNGKTVAAVAAAESPLSQFDFKVKEISSLLDDQPLITDIHFSLAQWIASFYFSSLGESLFLFLPFPKEIKSPAAEPADSGSPSKKAVPLQLTNEQSGVFAALRTEYEQREKRSAAVLLHGITGSGKTAVYAKLIEFVVAQGKQAVLLVPEIALTPQLTRFFKTVFAGQETAIVHSKISYKKKYYYWKKIRNGEIAIIIGARSVLFAPTKDLGVIIIDEEHETTYKNNSSPRYHARQVAQKRCAEEKALLVLGSATPSLETMYAAECGRILKLNLASRYNGVPLPAYEFYPHPQGAAIVSEAIVVEMRTVLAQGEKVLIYLNQRGFARSVGCKECGNILKCCDCSIALTFHQKRSLLLCHYCAHAEEIPSVCPSCGSKGLTFYGFGTERIEEELRGVFPESGIVRMDSDSITTEKKLRLALKSFESGEKKIMIGTQMITKGHDFSGMNMVIILYPERMLAFPDFRAAERTFHQISQVSGRAGRREKQGRVLIQTACADDLTILAGAKQDYEAFYRQELERRTVFSYVPFAKLCRLVFRGETRSAVSQTALQAGDFFRKSLSAPATAEILGPSPCPLERVKKNFRWNIIFKVTDMVFFRRQMRLFRETFKEGRGVYIEYDMNPIDML